MNNHNLFFKNTNTIASFSSHLWTSMLAVLSFKEIQDTKKRHTLVTLFNGSTNVEPLFYSPEREPKLYRKLCALDEKNKAKNSRIIVLSHPFIKTL